MICDDKKNSQNGSTVANDTDDSKRGQVILNLSPRANQLVKGIRATTGVPKEVALTQIIEWFSTLDPKLRLAVIVNDEETRSELLRAALIQMVAAGEAGDVIVGGEVSFNEAAEAVKKLLAVMQTQHMAQRAEIEDVLPSKKRKG